MSEHSAIVIPDDGEEMSRSIFDLPCPGQPYSDNALHAESQSASQSLKRKKCSLDEEFTKLRKRIDRCFEYKLEDVRKDMQQEIDSLRREIHCERQHHQKTQLELSRQTVG
ncbi:hypothetical protein N7493_000955 [Penicillium malachiteum]|uniref:Uncharacterized protein n=1 Tax=Penicillium malachiteum TaxID=1324776 RepID=A0AAD6HXB0_9EURO|nr:hypothetical protein N7493_000955 [Penicillium malachiteum]